MLASSAVQMLCLWVTRVQRPVSLETNLSCSVPTTFTQCTILKRKESKSKDFSSKRENVVLHRFVTATKQRQFYLKSRCHGQIKGVRRTHQERSPANAVQNPSALKAQRSLPSGKGNKSKESKEKIQNTELTLFLRICTCYMLWHSTCTGTTSRIHQEIIHSEDLKTKGTSPISPSRIFIRILQNF